MIDFLADIDVSLKSRYLTLERNIKSASNSFYDSFLDLLESTYKRILVNENVSFDNGITCGELLRTPNIMNFLRQNVGIADSTFDKSLNYIRKINEHKHQSEKHILIDTVILYMRLYYDIVSTYLKNKKHKNIGELDEDYFRNIFGLSLRLEEENKKLETKLQLALEDVKAMAREKQISSDEVLKLEQMISVALKEKSSERKNEKLNEQLYVIEDLKRNYDKRFEEQDKKISELEKKIAKFSGMYKSPKGTSSFNLKDFARGSTKVYENLNKGESFNRAKFLLVLNYFVVIAIGIASIILTSVSTSLFFSILETAWTIVCLVYLIKMIGCERLMQDYEIAKRSTFEYIQDEVGLYLPSGRAKRAHFYFRRLLYLGAIVSIICIWTIGGSSINGILATVLQVCLIIFTFLTIFSESNFFLYDVIHFKNNKYPGVEYEFWIAANKMIRKK